MPPTYRMRMPVDSVLDRYSCFCGCWPLLDCRMCNIPGDYALGRDDFVAVDVCMHSAGWDCERVECHPDSDMHFYACACGAMPLAWVSLGPSGPHDWRLVAASWWGMASCTPPC